MSFSWQKSYRTGSVPAALPPADPTDGTYEWAKIQQISDRTGVKLLTAVSGQPLPTFVMDIGTADENDKPTTINYNVATNSKWVTFVGAGTTGGSAAGNADAPMKLSYTLATIAGKTTPTGRVIRFAAKWNLGGVGATQYGEWYFTITAAPAPTNPPAPTTNTPTPPAPPAFPGP